MGAGSGRAPGQTIRPGCVPSAGQPARPGLQRFVSAPLQGAGSEPAMDVHKPSAMGGCGPGSGAGASPPGIHSLRQNCQHASTRTQLTRNAARAVRAQDPLL